MDVDSRQMLCQVSLAKGPYNITSLLQRSPLLVARIIAGAYCVRSLWPQLLIFVKPLHKHRYIHIYVGIHMHVGMRPKK